MASVAVPAGPTSSHPSPADCHRPVWWKALQLLPTVHGAVALVPICWRWGAGLGTGECLPCQLSQSCAHLFYNSTGDRHEAGESWAVQGTLPWLPAPEPHNPCLGKHAARSGGWHHTAVLRPGTYHNPGVRPEVTVLAEKRQRAMAGMSQGPGKTTFL